MRDNMRCRHDFGRWRRHPDVMTTFLRFCRDCGHADTRAIGMDDVPPTAADGPRERKR